MAGRGNAYGTSVTGSTDSAGRSTASAAATAATRPCTSSHRPNCKLIDGTLAGSLTALDQVPATLETSNFTTSPKIPTGKAAAK